jgi:mono/diheme cytochrome c family protein
VLGIIIAGIVGLVAVGPLIVAHRQDLPLETKYGSYAVSVAARLGAPTVGNWTSQSFRGAEAGRAAFTGSCASCHGATGNGKGVFGQATYPPATDLTTNDAKEKSDAELFWITKNGLSFTGMPAFGSQYSDQEIWSLVQYVRSLQNGQATSENVPEPTMAQLQVADPHGNAAQRGAAVYFAQGCQYCHGAVGNASGQLALRGGREGDRAIRDGRRGMPAYGTDLISDAELADLQAYMATFSDGGSTGSDGGGD